MPNRPQSAALHESVRDELPCEWYGRNMGQHSWIELPQHGIKRCEKCKLQYWLDGCLVRECAGDGHTFLKGCEKHPPDDAIPSKAQPEPERGTEPDVKAIAHTLWYRGGRMRSELQDALALHPEIWHKEGLERMLAQWDEIANNYAANVLLAKAPSPLPVRDQSAWINVKDKLPAKRTKRYWPSPGRRRTDALQD